MVESVNVEDQKKLSHKAFLSEVNDLTIYETLCKTIHAAHLVGYRNNPMVWSGRYRSNGQVNVDELLNNSDEILKLDSTMILI